MLRILRRILKLSAAEGLSDGNTKFYTFKGGFTYYEEDSYQ